MATTILRGRWRIAAVVLVMLVGCPRTPVAPNDAKPDSDGDGIPDDRDKCPNDKETVNGYEDDDGCPDKANVIATDHKDYALSEIYFATGASQPGAESSPLLDEMAAMMKASPDMFVVVEIAGHADEVEQDPVLLSNQRAEAVRTALVSRGIAATRFKTAGYGAYCPRDPDKTALARQRNRRVKFLVLESSEGPTNNERGCKAASAAGIPASTSTTSSATIAKPPPPPPDFLEAKCGPGKSTCGSGPHSACCGAGEHCCAGGAAGSYYCRKGTGPCPPLP